MLRSVSLSLNQTTDSPLVTERRESENRGVSPEGVGEGEERLIVGGGGKGEESYCFEYCSFDYLHLSRTSFLPPHFRIELESVGVQG